MKYTTGRKALLAAALWMLWLAPAWAATNLTDFPLDNGMTVIYLRDPGNPVVTLDLVIPGTSLRQTAETMGLERMVLDLIPRGNTVTDKTALNRLLDRTGASIWPTSDRDLSSLRMTCVRPFFDQTLNLFANSWRVPLFAPEEIEIVRQKQLATIRAKDDNPDELLATRLNTVFYAGHPYQYDLDGTPETVTSFDETAIRAHHALLLNQAGNFLVVVADLDPVHLKERLNTAFGKLPRLLYLANTLPAFSQPTGEVFLEDRPLPTRYIMAKFPAPAPDDEDFAALKLATRILSHRLWESVRTRQGLAYAVQAGLAASLTNFGYLYISTGAEQAAMRTIFAEITRMKNEPVPEHELTAAKAVFGTDYYMATESPASQARRLAEGHIYLGDYTRRHELVTLVNAVTAEQIQDVTRRWVNAMTFVVLGEAAHVTPDNFSPPKD